MTKKLLQAASLCILAISSEAANVPGYIETTLQTNATDPQLLNPWGVAFSATSPFWISDQAAGVSTLYNSAGVKQALVVSMPTGSNLVTGQVFNGTASFNADNFLFATENGTITGWRGALGTSAEKLFSVTGADFTGLAISTTKSTIFAADFATGKLDVFNSSGLSGSFTDPGAPAGYSVFNVQNINGQIYVTFAPKSSTGDQVAGVGNGYVSIFNPTTGTFTKVVSGGALNDPWGVALAPTTGFGALSGDLLIGNFGDGLINGYDPTTGAFVGTLADVKGTAIANDGLWALTFGNGGNGGLTTSLYITAGPNDETGGLFASISAAPEPSEVLLLVGGLSLLVWRGRKVVSK